jgi:release factor glutamine methyltransferase
LWLSLFCVVSFTLKESVMSAQQTTWTIGGLLDWTAKFLAQKGSEFPRLDAEVLLAQALGCKRIELYTRYEETAPDEARGRMRELVRQRLEGCPVAYLVGRKEFFSLELEVNRDVLIPRPDTEVLVVECLRLAKPLAEPTVVDIGTGSGAIAVAIAKQHKAARVSAVDVSAAALAVAQRNAEKHKVSDRVTFLEGDLFAPLPAGEAFDFVVSNPPYIRHDDIAGLVPGVRDYEPHVALDGGPSGFDVFDRLIADAKDHLKPGGYLLVEIGSPQEKEARTRIEADGAYELGKTVKDGSGHPRVLIARRR